MRGPGRAPLKPAGSPMPGPPQAPPRPYGQMPPQPTAARFGLPDGFKAFGIAYLSIRGVLLLLGLAVLAVALLALGSAGSDLQAGVRIGVAIYSVILLLGIGYVVTAGVLALKGKLAGPIMGAVDSGATVLLGLLGIVLETVRGKVNEFTVLPGFLLIINILLLVLSWRAINGWRAFRHALAIRQQGQIRMAAMAAQGMSPSANVAPPRRPQQAPVQRRTTSRPAAIAKLIGGAVSANGMPSERRLQLARQAAKRLVEERHSEIVDDVLKTAPIVDDPQEFVLPLARVLRAVPDAALARGILQAAREVARSDGNVDPLAEEYFSVLASALKPPA